MVFFWLAIVHWLNSLVFTPLFYCSYTYEIIAGKNFVIRHVSNKWGVWHLILFPADDVMCTRCWCMISRFVCIGMHAYVSTYTVYNNNNNKKFVFFVYISNDCESLIRIKRKTKRCLVQFEPKQKCDFYLSVGPIAPSTPVQTGAYDDSRPQSTAQIQYDYSGYDQFQWLNPQYQVPYHPYLRQQLLQQAAAVAPATILKKTIKKEKSRDKKNKAKKE